MLYCKQRKQQTIEYTYFSFEFRTRTYIITDANWRRGLSAGLFVLQNRSPLHNTAKSRVNLTGGKTNEKSVYTAYDELPLFLNAETVAKLLGISISSSYELMHEKGFPSLRIGSRLIVPKEKFRAWVEEKTGGGI